MKKIAIAATAGLLAAASWTSALSQPASDGDPGTPRSCEAQWSAMQKAGTTGGETRAAFMDHCVTHQSDPGDGHQLALIATLASGIVFTVLQPNPERPASP